MSVKLRAPLPAINTTTILPNPQLGDTASRRHEVRVFRSMTGVKRSWIKPNTRQLLTYQFLLDRLKAEELKRFVQAHYADKIRLENHKDEIWEGYFANNPVTFSTAARGRISVQLQFEGEKVS